MTELLRQIDPDSGFDREFGVGFSLCYDNCKSACGNARAGIVDDPATDGWVPAGQQRVGDDFLKPPTPGNGQQVILALRFRDFDQILRTQAGGFLQDGSGDGDFVVSREEADDGGRRPGNGSELRAHFSKRDTGTHICDRPNFYRLNEAFEHVVEYLDLIAREAAGG